MKGKKDKYDELIKQALRDEMDEIQVPDFDPMWQKIQGELSTIEEERNKEIRKSKRRTMRFAVMAASFIICVTVALTYTTQKGSASYASFMEFVSSVFNGTTHLKGDTVRHVEEESDDPLSHEDMNPSQYELNAQKEEAEMLSKQVQQPSYLPAGYQLDHKMLKSSPGADGGKRLLGAEFIYTNSNGDQIKYTQSILPNGSSQDLSVNKESGIQKKEVDGYEYTVISPPNNPILIIMWSKGDFSFILRGNDEKELLKMANSTR